MPLGPPELLLILVIVLIIFGAGKLPQVFGSLGKGVREFRDASEGRDTPDAVPPAQNTTASGTTGTVAPSGSVRPADHAAGPPAQTAAPVSSPPGTDREAR